MTTLFSGGCACGAIRYECSAKPILAANCHCRDCQRASGSAFASILVVPAEAFRLSGEPRFHRVLSQSGNPMLRGFCSACGSPLLVKEPHRPKIVLIQAASLDEPERHEPSMEIFTTRAQPWAAMHPELPKFPEMPPIPESLGR